MLGDPLCGLFSSGTGLRVMAVDGVNLSVARGECLGLVFAVRDNFRQRRDTHGKPAFLFRLQNNGELPRVINHDLPFLNRMN